MEMVERAVETYDHLLWEAIIRVCGGAISKGFRQQRGSASVTYEVPADPRLHLQEIEQEIFSFIISGLSIAKTSCGSLEELKEICSRDEYRKFVEDAGRLWESPFRVVQIGKRRSEKWVSCPCDGEHLNCTGELNMFKIELKGPRNVGKDTYKFHFVISSQR